jgi:hypothetical protein
MWVPVGAQRPQKAPRRWVLFVSRPLVACSDAGNHSDNGREEPNPASGSGHGFLLPPQRKPVERILRDQVQAYVARRTAPPPGPLYVSVPAQELTLYAEQIQVFLHPQKGAEMAWLRPLILRLPYSEPGATTGRGTAPGSSATPGASAAPAGAAPSSEEHMPQVYLCAGLVSDIVIPAGCCSRIVSEWEKTMIRMYVVASQYQAACNAADDTARARIMTLYGRWLREICGAD